METGCVGVDLVELERWKARASQFVHSSQNPARSFRLLRDKVVSLFGLGDLRLPIKQDRRKPYPCSLTPVASDVHACVQEDTIEVQRPCCIAPVVCVAGGVDGADDYSIGTLVLRPWPPGDLNHQP